MLATRPLLSCDIIVAAEHARFGLPEPLVGAVALGGGLHRLARQIGLKQAMSMILTGRSVSAAEGARFGFVNEIVGASELRHAIDRWCEQILECAPLAIRASKETVMRGLSLTAFATRRLIRRLPLGRLPKTRSKVRAPSLRRDRRVGVAFEASSQASPLSTCRECAFASLTAMKTQQSRDSARAARSGPDHHLPPDGFG